MDLSHYPNVWPDMLPALEAALLKHEEGKAKLAAFRKQLTSAKKKAKRVENYVATIDEEYGKYYELSMLESVRLAENKFVLINKKLKHFREHEEKYFKQSLRKLKGSGMEPRNTQWYIEQVAVYGYKTNSLLLEVADILRIAKGHLDKVDHMKKYWAQIRKRRRPS